MQPLLLLPRRILSGVVRAYQIFVSPLLPPSCRFTPSCSQYALEALTRHGALKGSWLAARRLARCHPWNRGGYDPVPKLKVSGMRGRHCEEAAPPPPKQSP